MHEIIPASLPSFYHWKGKTPTATLDNIRELFRSQGIVCRYNLIAKDEELIVPYITTTIDNSKNAAYACVLSKLVEYGMPTAHVDQYITKICDETPYNPVVEWIQSKPWDRKDRLKEFLATIEAENNEAKDMFIYHWMVGAVALGFSAEGHDSNGVLVLQGKQNMGKTWWFRKLCPKELQRADASIVTSDKDSVAQVINKWLVELGELDATFRKSDIAALKSFITRREDILRMPYAKKASCFPRRTAFAASVNEKNYLHDTENRRYWTIECKSVNSYHEIDMQQVWAQVYHDWLAGASVSLPEDGRKLLTSINEDHQQIDPLFEMIMEKYDWENAYIWDWKTATAICQEIGLKTITKKETRIVSQFVMELNGNQRKRERSGRLLRVPG